MKIIILTFHYANNYGAVLQCYALSEIIKNFGHTVELLNFHPVKGKIPLKKVLNNYLLTNRFNSFRKHYLPKISKSFTSYEALSKNYPKADLYIVGSDQVWNPQITGDKLLIYFFNFLKDNERRASYAASFGIEHWNETSIDKCIKQSLRKFEAVSIREDVGVKLCESNFEINSTQVLDPTLLLNNYDKLLSSFRTNIDLGIIVYKFKRTAELYDFFPKLSTVLNSKITCINDHRIFKNGANTSYFTSVEKWIWQIKNSSLVITDSFHCMVFAIIYKRPFIAMPAHPDRLSRMLSLLQDLGLEDRFFMTYDDILNSNILFKKINYDSVFSKLESKRSLSLNFLNSLFDKK